MYYKELPEITEKQKEIVELIYRFRFINRKQLQRLFNHKDARRINTWLRDLVSKNYLGRIYSKKLLENTKPAIYYLSNNGIIWVRYEKGMEYGADLEQIDFKYLRKFYEDKHASQTFVNHCVSIFEFYLQLKEVERDANREIVKQRKKLKAYDEDLDKKLDYHVETKTEMWIQGQLHHGHDEDFNEIKQYIPDLYIEKLDNPSEENMKTQTFFLELFDSHMPRYAIRYRIKKYIEFKEGKRWSLYSAMDGKFPMIILIFPHHRKMNSVISYIREQLERSYESDDITFLLTTYQKAITKGITDNSIWQEVKGE